MGVDQECVFSYGVVIPDGDRYKLHENICKFNGLEDPDIDDFCPQINEACDTKLLHCHDCYTDEGEGYLYFEDLGITGYYSLFKKVSTEDSVTFSISEKHRRAAAMFFEQSKYSEVTKIEKPKFCWSVFQYMS